jgi:hypothetical protein
MHTQSDSQVGSNMTTGKLSRGLHRRWQHVCRRYTTSTREGGCPLYLFERLDLFVLYESFPPAGISIKSSRTERPASRRHFDPAKQGPAPTTLAWSALMSARRATNKNKPTIGQKQLPSWGQTSACRRQCKADAPCLDLPSCIALVGPACIADQSPANRSVSG